MCTLQCAHFKWMCTLHPHWSICSKTYLSPIIVNRYIVVAGRAMSNIRVQTYCERTFLHDFEIQPFWGAAFLSRKSTCLERPLFLDIEGVHPRQVSPYYFLWFALLSHDWDRICCEGRCWEMRDFRMGSLSVNSVLDQDQNALRLWTRAFWPWPSASCFLALAKHLIGKYAISA